MVVIDDPAFAALLAESVRRDDKPANPWTIARRDRLPTLPGVKASQGGLQSTALTRPKPRPDRRSFLLLVAGAYGRVALGGDLLG